jgi:hypothetical protein
MEHRLGRIGWYSLLCVLLWAVLILPRGLGWHSITESLWTEDSSIFLNQAYSLGSATLWTSYQGYLHTFQRLVCLLAVRLPLAATPYLLCTGWCVAFVAMVYVLDQRLRRRGFHLAWIAAVVSLIALQPHGGEVYFSLTNTQWVLGLTLALYLCLPEPDPRHRIELLAVAVVCITGPFSLLFLPILAVQALTRRDIATRWRTYLLVTAGALVQLMVLLGSNRLKTPVVTGDTFTNWMTAAVTFMTFGTRTGVVVSLAVAFWAAVLLAAARILVRRRAHERLGDVAYLLSGAFLMFGVSLYSVSLWSSVTSISPLGGGGRYYFVPYGLVFTAALLLVHAARAVVFPVRPWMQAGVAFAVCAISFGPERRENLQWQAFARFATLHPGIEIPINPQWNFSPTWKVIPPESATTRSVSAISIPLENSSIGPSGVVFKVVACGDSKMIGLEADVWREKAGYAVMEWWSDGAGSGESRKLQRYYPEGAVRMQFAFSRQRGQTLVRVMPSVSADATIRTLSIYCL